VNHRQKSIAVAVIIAGCLALNWAVGLLTVAGAQEEEAPLNIGSRLELFVDDYLLDAMDGVTRKLHSPVRREVVMTFDRPWEGQVSMAHCVFQDGDIYRMYYRGCGINRPLSEYPNVYGPRVTCYAESTDGIHWTRPNLGLVEYDGSKENNILDIGNLGGLMPFIDANPACLPEQRYKALASVPIRALASPDGIHWEYMSPEPVIETTGDRGGLAFYDTLRGEYRAYIREWIDGVRTICTSTSKDFIQWTPRELCRYGDTPMEQLYTNATIPYFRAPHIFLSFPKRFVPDRKKLPEVPQSGLSEGVFMSSRDGLNFDRSFMEAWIRAGLDKYCWLHRNVLIAWGFLQTAPDELSFYWTEHYHLQDIPCQLRRGTIRLDGFVSVNAPYAGGEFTTKPLTFDGRELVINYSTSAVGSVQVEIQDAGGNPVNGFTLAQCPEIYGDQIERVVTWEGGSDVSTLAGKPVRLRFVMRDADLYSIRFRP